MTASLFTLPCYYVIYTMYNHIYIYIYIYLYKHVYVHIPEYLPSCLVDTFYIFCLSHDIITLVRFTTTPPKKQKVPVLYTYMSIWIGINDLPHR